MPSPMIFFQFWKYLESAKRAKEFVTTPFMEGEETGVLSPPLHVTKDYSFKATECSLCRCAKKEAMAIRLTIVKYNLDILKTDIGLPFVGFEVTATRFPPHVQEMLFSPSSSPKLKNHMDYWFICANCEMHARKYFDELGVVTVLSHDDEKQLCEFVPFAIGQLILAYANANLMQLRSTTNDKLEGDAPNYKRARLDKFID